MEKEVFVYHVANFGIIVVEFRMSQVFVPVLAFDDVKGLSRWSYNGRIVALERKTAISRYAIVAVFASAPKEGEYGKEKVLEMLIEHRIHGLESRALGGRVRRGDAVANFLFEEILDLVDFLEIVRVVGGVSVADLLLGENVDRIRVVALH